MFGLNENAKNTDSFQTKLFRDRSATMLVDEYRVSLDLERQSNRFGFAEINTLEQQVDAVGIARLDHVQECVRFRRYFWQPCDRYGEF